MPKLSLVLTVAALVALGSGLPWRDALRLNAARLTVERSLFGASDGRESAAAEARADAAALASRVENSRVQALVGGVARIHGDTTAAVSALTLAVTRDPGDDTSREFLADTLFRAGQEDVAVQQWQQARAGRMVRRRAQAAMSAGDTAAALAYFRVRTRVDTTTASPWLELGDTYNELQDLEAARASYEELIKRWPGHAIGYARLANLYFFRMGRPDLAAAVLDKAIAIAPGAEFYMVRSQIAAQQRRFADAEADARQTLALDPRNATYLLWLGDLLYDQKRLEEAVAQYDRAVELSPNPSVRFLAPLKKGRALTEAGRLDEAVAAYETAVAAGVAQRVPADTLAGYYVRLGEACLRLDRISRATSAFTQALALDPANSSAANHLKALSAR